MHFYVQNCISVLFLSDVSGCSSSDEEMAATSKEQLKAKTFSCITCGKTLSSQGHLVRHERKHTEQKDFTCKRCNISFPTAEERRLHSKEHSMEKRFSCEQCEFFFTSARNMKIHIKTHNKSLSTAENVTSISAPKEILMLISESIREKDHTSVLTARRASIMDLI